MAGMHGTPKANNLNSRGCNPRKGCANALGPEGAEQSGEQFGIF